MEPRNILFSPPDISDEEINEVTAALKSGWITTGPRTKELEKQLKDFCGSTGYACLNSATAALECCLRALGIGPGDEVITSAYTYTASCSPICHVGATPVMCDVAEGSFEMDYDVLGSLITEETKAIVPVDLGGCMINYDKLFEVVQAHKDLWKPANDIQKCFDRVIVIADAAHSLGATYHGKHSGAVADFSSFSFHAVKNFTTAEGGAITWKSFDGIDDEEILSAIRFHTTGRPNMTALEEVIFLADLVEDSRDYPGVEELRELVYSGEFDKAIVKSIDNTISVLLRKKSTLHTRTVDARNYYIRKIRRMEKE